MIGWLKKTGVQDREDERPAFEQYPGDAGEEFVQVGDVHQHHVCEDDVEPPPRVWGRLGEVMNLPGQLRVGRPRLSDESRAAVDAEDIGPSCGEAGAEPAVPAAQVKDVATVQVGADLGLEEGGKPAVEGVVVGSDRCGVGRSDAVPTIEVTVGHGPTVGL